MAEMCPLVEGGRTTNDGYLWDGDIPAACQKCLAQALIHTELFERELPVNVGVLKSDSDEVEVPSTGVRLAGAGLRLVKEEVALDVNDSEDNGMVNRVAVYAFDCLATGIIE